jgi:hypothetical protein
MELFPPMPLASWQDTKQTLHRFCQVVGKLRLAASVRRNHWWNVPFHLTGRGITTRPMGQVDGNPIFTIASRSPPSPTRPSRPWPASGSR